MNSKTTLPISEARKKIFEIADAVQRPNIHYTLTDKGRPKAVIISIEQYESWVETMEVMRDFPDLKKDIAEVHADIKSGEYKNYITLEQLLAKEGFVVADKSKNKYNVSTKPKARSSKGIKKAK